MGLQLPASDAQVIEIGYLVHYLLDANLGDGVLRNDVENWWPFTEINARWKLIFFPFEATLDEKSSTENLTRKILRITLGTSSRFIYAVQIWNVWTSNPILRLKWSNL